MATAGPLPLFERRDELVSLIGMITASLLVCWMDSLEVHQSVVSELHWSSMTHPMIGKRIFKMVALEPLPRQHGHYYLPSLA